MDQALKEIPVFWKESQSTFFASVKHQVQTPVPSKKKKKKEFASKN
jgi:hypothetical protein